MATTRRSRLGWLGNLRIYTQSDKGAWVDFTCGHCGRGVTGFKIAGMDQEYWLICPSCKMGTVGNILLKVSYPGVKFGQELQGLPSDVAEAYDEARRSMSVNAFVGAELICRKILMHIAVDKGAAEGESFQSYIDHLQAEGHITPTMKPWVDLIREHGNMVTHTLEEPDGERAKHTVIFTAELLRVIYEMEYLSKQVEEGKQE